MRRARLPANVTLERDIPVPMRDGVRLSANVFRSVDEGHHAPVILSVTPYGKDALPDRWGMFFMRLAGVRFGHLDCSSWTGFEAPDPVFWTAAGYVVVQADVRGMHKSEGHAGVLTNQDAQDYYDLIEWAGSQEWSTGAVGLLGVSYLAMSQWRVAPLHPPSLKAMIPWEGVTDLLREFGYQDGVPETGFIGIWWRFRMKLGRNRRFAFTEDFPKQRDAHPLDDDWWKEKQPHLEAITVPSLVCVNWSDHGLHTRGSLEGFERIGSPDKWLFTHGRRKWETFYSAEARALQLRFFDYYLKGASNGRPASLKAQWLETPRVRLEVRKSRSAYSIRSESQWPLPSVRYRHLYLDAKTSRMSLHPTSEECAASYRPRAMMRTERASFLYSFDCETELTGSMTLKLWVSTSEGDDLDLFAILRKIDAKGKEVHFYGYNGYAKDGVAKGWLRASHRELDPLLTRPGRPWHTHRTIQRIKPGEIIALEMEVLASSTLFEAGSSLRVDVLGRDAAKYPAFRHRRTVNVGRHYIHTGGSFDSHLLAPFVMS